MARLQVSFDAGDVPLDAAGTARVRLPDGETALLSLRRSDATTFSGSFPLRGPGAYWVSVAVESADGGRVMGSSGAVSSYEEEFAFREPDPALADDGHRGHRWQGRPGARRGVRPGTGRGPCAGGHLAVAWLQRRWRCSASTSPCAGWSSPPTSRTPQGGIQPPRSKAPPPPPPEPVTEAPVTTEEATVDRLLRRRRR